jgi:hypothetical protein
MEMALINSLFLTNLWTFLSDVCWRCPSTWIGVVFVWYYGRGWVERVGVALTDKVKVSFRFLCIGGLIFVLCYDYLPILLMLMPEFVVPAIFMVSGDFDLLSVTLIFLIYGCIMLLLGGALFNFVKRPANASMAIIAGSRKEPVVGAVINVSNEGDVKQKVDEFIKPWIERIIALEEEKTVSELKSLPIAADK